MSSPALAAGGGQPVARVPASARLAAWVPRLVLAPSFVVTGTAWKWILNPGLGLEKVLHEWGWTSFSFDWLVNPDRAVYTIVIAGVWQSSGFVIALFLAGLRGIDDSILKAAQIDGAS